MNPTETPSPVHYVGDLTEDGIQPFRVAAPDGFDADAVTAIATTPGMEFQAGIKNAADAPDAQGMLIRSATKFKDAAAFERHQMLLYLIRSGVGYDNIDVTLASRAGVATLNTPGASTTPVARRTLTLVSAWAARIVPGTDSLRAGKWEKKNPQVEPIDLTEKTLGIVGYGRIGKETQRLAKAQELFKGVLHYDVLGGNSNTPIEELVAKADVMTLSAGGKDEILTPELLKNVKPGTLIVNTGRGGNINKEAILAAMDRGVHFATDVFWEEGPKMFDDPVTAQIVAHPNFFGTPHTAASDEVTQRQLGTEGSTRMIEFATQGIVNPHDIPGHTLGRFDLGRREAPGVRGIVTHQSVPGKLEAISGALHGKGMNIVRVQNAEGGINGGHRLAMTQFDLDHTVEPEQAVAVMRDIARQVEAYRTRLLLFAKESNA
ncbi:MAG: NAD(P)-dependent oxidoreductase [Candidatus Peribacteraceae bacterium]|nr:NAD(P)-dependent oxidoreductase [Candidatus Peribacteraceae bacterium]